MQGDRVYEPYGLGRRGRDDGCFHYTGESQYGDQEMKSGNAAILNHEAEGRALRVFMGARGTTGLKVLVQSPRFAGGRLLGLVGRPTVHPNRLTSGSLRLR